jgi:hypothetical protein
MAKTQRLLTAAELDLIEAIIHWSRLNSWTRGDLATLLVEEMKDGGMGSLQFVNSSAGARRLGSAIGEAWFKDADGVPACAQLTSDQDGRLFELDVWKVDFSPLRRIPPVSEIRHEPDNAKHEGRLDDRR